MKIGIHIHIYTQAYNIEYIHFNSFILFAIVLIKYLIKKVFNKKNKPRFIYLQISKICILIDFTVTYIHIHIHMYIIAMNLTRYIIFYLTLDLF